MANEVKGIQALVYIGDDGSPADYTSLEGQTDVTIDLAPEFADTTDKNNSGWRTSLNVLRGFTVTGTCNLKATAASATAQDRLMNAAQGGTNIYVRAYVASDRYYEAECSAGVNFTGPTADITKINFTLQAAGEVESFGFSTGF